MDGAKTPDANGDAMLVDTAAGEAVLNDTIAVIRPPRPASSSSLTTARSTPSLDMFDPSNYPAGVYTDTIPSDAKFYVEIKPKGPDFEREDYLIDEEEFKIVGIIGEIGEGDDIKYEVQFGDDHLAKVSLIKLFCYKNAEKALKEYQTHRRSRRRSQQRRKETRSFQLLSDSDSDDMQSSSDERPNKRRRTLVRGSQRTIAHSARRNTRLTRSGRLLSLKYGDDDDEELSDSTATRRSTRVQKTKSRLRYDDSYLSDDYESEVASLRTSRSSAKPRTPKAKEFFPTADDESEFTKRHHFLCMHSGDMEAIQDDDGRSYTMCQGCSFVYHVECLGDRATRSGTRGHNVIVLDERSNERTCVLQCGRCSGGGKNGAITMRCIGCGEIGDRCGEFEYPKKVEGSDEMDVNGFSERNSQLEDRLLQGWNDGSKLMFRCVDCHRGYHFHHMPPISSKRKNSRKQLEEIVVQTNGSQYTGQDDQMDFDNPEGDKSTASVAKISSPKPAPQDETADQSIDQAELPSDLSEEQSLSLRHWRCDQCTQYFDKKVEKVLGWRLIAMPSYSAADVSEDFLREYLVKFENESYSRISWVPGTWLSGVSFMIKRNFDVEQRSPIKTPEDVIPEAWLRADIIFDVRYEGDRLHDQMHFRTQNEELEALSKVTDALCKFQRLKYEDSTWDAIPKQDTGRFDDFKAAYEEYVRGNWTHAPPYRKQKGPYADTSKPEDVIQAEFGHRLEKKTQPEWMEGGTMFDYQIEGMNWLYFQWYKRTSAILADEMGLGKTIQVIAMVSTIFKEQRRWPFLVVAPSSTLENWRREFKKWAPAMRVVVWPGTSEGRELVRVYELCRPKTPRDLKAHVVITAYHTARETLSFLRKHEWECLIIDEGHAVKNDRSELSQALGAVRAHHRVILTGTPLQNNIRELFNIMQYDLFLTPLTIRFLDPVNFNSEKLEQKYQELDEVKVREIHEMLRPRFLRRTKTDVLTLPPMSEIIIPLSMSSVQKELYKSIVSQNADLMKSITARVEKGAAQPKSTTPKLQNILMQLRKCLAHPFVHSPDLEERNVDFEQEMRALVEASGKLSFLSKLLPKLKEQGHRCLIFSQFLDCLNILEDFLTGIGFTYGRLTGDTATSDRQQMIDAFNAPDSKMDCFLLSTRAGGSGINLATADTVIVYDPDHNPHQDLQALARAHRIGQQNKLLVFRLMTRNSMYQTSKKKMVLDHLIVESLDKDDEKLDVEGILLHGLKAIFENNGEKDIKYVDADIDKLIDRSRIEEITRHESASETNLGSFKTARVWANSTAKLEDLPDENKNSLESDYWDKIIKERMSIAEAQRRAQQEEIGRGKRRASKKINYAMVDSPAHERNADMLDRQSDDEKLNHQSDSDDEEFIEIADEPSEDDNESDPFIDLTKDDIDLDHRKPASIPLGPKPDLDKPPVAQPRQTVPNRPPMPIQTAIRSSPLKRRPDHAPRMKPSPLPGYIVHPRGFTVQSPLQHLQYHVGMMAHHPPLPINPYQPLPLTPVPSQLFPPQPQGNPRPPPSFSPLPQHRPASLMDPPQRNPSPLYHNPPPAPLPLVEQRPPIPPHSSQHKPSTPPKLRLPPAPPKPKPSKPARTKQVPHNPIEAQVPRPVTHTNPLKCTLCGSTHIRGLCPLRDVSLDQCPACGFHHLHLNRTCPVLQELSYVEILHQRLNESTEDRNVVKAAKAYISGVRTDLALREKGERPFKARDRKKKE